MGYMKADKVLPQELVELIQTYIDGECLYIPRKKQNKKGWGEKTGAKTVLEARDNDIYNQYELGRTINELAEHFFLSQKSIERIVYKQKRHTSKGAVHQVIKK